MTVSDQKRRRHVARAKIAKRRETAWDLRLSGASLREIAGQLDVGLATVHRDIQFVLKDLQKRSLDSAEKWRNVIIARMERIYLTAMARGDDAALHAAIRSQREIVRVLGLDKREEVEVDDDKSVRPTIVVVPDPQDLGDGADMDVN